MATSAAVVAGEFSSTSRPTSLGEQGQHSCHQQAAQREEQDFNED